MSLCINPDCPQPAHPNNGHSVTCHACGSGLLLQGRYRVMRLLSNNSGFGTVYEAYQQDIPKILKVLKRDRSENPKVLTLFRKEADVLSQLNHAGVPFVEQDGYFTYRPKGSEIPLHCIVMEKIDGPNLLQWMQQQGNHPIGERQAFRWLSQLTEILRRVHQHNYFHRDIKPDNVMLRSSGQLVLVDFGAAREMSQTYLAQIGSLGVTTISSAGYTPPEQEQGQAVPQSDFYALGRTIIYLLTGRSPNDTALYDPLFNSFNWRSYALPLSEGFAALLDSLISPRVIDRPKTAQEILDRLYQLSLEQASPENDAGALFAETTPPINSASSANSLQRSRQKQPDAALKSNAAVASPTSSVTYWTWLIAGGVVVAAIAFVGLGILGRHRALVSSSLENSTPEVIPPDVPADEDAPEIRAELLRTFSAHGNSVNALKLLSDRRRFLSASADSTIRLWDLSTGTELQTFVGHRTFVNAIAVSPDEQTLYSGSANGSMVAWSMETGDKIAEFPGHSGPINALVRNPDGQMLVSGGSDGTIKVWDIDSQAIMRTLEGHSGAVNTLAVTSDGQYIISGGTDRTIRQWNLQTGEQTKLLEGHASFVNEIAVSPDGRFLFSASADNTLKRWDLERGEILETLLGHDSYVNVLTISRDGQIVTSGSADETVRAWKVASGELLAVYTGFDMPVDHIILPSDRQLLTASRENPAIKTWSVNSN
ncbi:serine/threonine protein kinase [Oscillatoria sp. CS-180]|uniref:serine/threonine-protein kinase n=1 Tax=Oscillatoria sp. CS-180 TaxID=3021720 RepID=UPI00232E5D01|nr:serine/threonine-protein kinase [Oscillatoria sp. CS-180]MDB9528854.1 serine/threonine protein kinase [Oscillatoria sp. CS-180]